DREDHVDRQADQLGCEPGKLFNFVGPAKLDDDVLTLDPPQVAQTCPQYLDPRGPSGSGPETQVSNPLHPRRLLPSRALHLGREQQSTASDQSNELTPLHVEHGDVSPMRYQRRRLARSQSSAPSACRRAAGKSLGPI